jgi:hypothetical protein
LHANFYLVHTDSSILSILSILSIPLPNLSHTDYQPSNQPQPPTMSAELNVTDTTTAARSIAGAPQSSDDLQIKQDGGVEHVKDNEGEEKQGDGGDKTVFDDAGNFNVKVSLLLSGEVVRRLYV